MKKQYKTEEGFDIRLEARLKNAALIGAREMAGLSAKEASERIGICYAAYLGYESMKQYPSEETQRKICDFYRNLGIFLFEEDVFPEELKNIKPKRRYTAEKTIPKPELISLSTVDRRLLPIIEGELEKRAEHEELKEKIDEALSKLTYSEERVIRLRYLEEDMTLQKIGDIFKVTPERVRQIEAKALKKLRRYHIDLREFNEDYERR
jgi:RNA polymerase sigma factor (sigma-70 family)